MTQDMREATAAIDALIDALGQLDVVDLSPVVRSRMPKGEAHPEAQILERARTIERDGYRLQTLILPEHVSAHVDAPAHVQADRPDATIDKVAPTALWGRAVCVDLSDREWSPGELVKVDEFMGAAARAGSTIREDDLVIVNYGWNRHLQEGGLGGDYWGANAPGFTEDLCRELRDLGVRAVCSDSPSCDASLVEGRLETAYGHLEYFLPNDIYILECLANLEQVPSIAYFAALPLKIEGGSGSPLRPIALVPRA
jgi:kynurenine formamidase